MPFHRLHQWLYSGVPRYRNWHCRRTHRRLVRQGVVEYAGLRFDVRASHPPAAEAMADGSYEAAEQALCQKLLRPDDQVLECGGNVGYLALLAQRVWGISSWVSLEPNPRTAALYRANFALNGVAPKLIEAAAAPHDGQAIFYCAEINAEDSLVADPLGREQITVQTLSFPSILARIGFPPTALVIDIEGAETWLLEAELPESVRVIVVEFHPHVIGHKQCFAILALLFRRGFAVELVEGQTYGLVRRTPNAGN